MTCCNFVVVVFVAAIGAIVGSVLGLVILERALRPAEMRGHQPRAVAGDLKAPPKKP